MRLLVDMNLSPVWVERLQHGGWEAEHWSRIGDPRATDAEIMRFARQNDWIVFTHDLDFGTLLAHSKAGKPSVFQVRARDISPNHLAMTVMRTLEQFRSQLAAGALVTLDDQSRRVRLLPLA